MDDGDMPVIERQVVRMVVLDADDRVLLFHTREPVAPEFGSWWELPGGGIEPSEDEATAAVRELREETGLIVDTDMVGEGTWRRLASFRHGANRHVQHEVVLAIRLSSRRPRVDLANQQSHELEVYFDWAWWDIERIVEAQDQVFYPRSLPSCLRPFLAGQEIDEPMEWWP